MLWLKALHIVFVVAWFTGLFALPRLFIYHCGVTDAEGHDRFVVMERRMFGMMTLGATMTLVFGISMVTLAPGFLSMPWLHAKLTLVALLLVHHVYCYRLLAAFRERRNTHSERWLRIFNELPFLVLLGAVFLVIFKPTF